MKIGYGGESFGRQSPVKFIQSAQILIFIVQVSGHKIHVGCQIIKEIRCERSTQHADTNVGILFCQRVHYRNRHGYVTHSREPYDEQMFGLHLFFVENRVGGRVIVHLHLSVHLHIFSSRLDVIQQLIYGCSQVFLLFQQHVQLGHTCIFMLF